MIEEINSETTLYDPSVGDLSLAFLDTVSWRGRDEPEEKLQSCADLFTWACEAGLIDAARAEALAAQAEARPEQAQAALAQMVRLREQLYRIFKALIGGRSPQAEDVLRFNQVLSPALAQREIQVTGAVPEWVWREGASPLLDPFRPVLLAAAHLMVSEELAHIRTCGNEECGWIFVDRSRNHSRKWCSSEACGNRIRVRQFYSRSRKTE